MLPVIKRSQNAGSILCAAAQRAYAASRPPYEQIEVLAGAFPDLDSDIDARCWCCGLTREGRLPQTLHAWHFRLLPHLPTCLLAHLSVLLHRSASPTALVLLPKALRVHRWRDLQQRDGGAGSRQGLQGAQLARRPPCHVARHTLQAGRLHVQVVDARALLDDCAVTASATPTH